MTDVSESCVAFSLIRFSGLTADDMKGVTTKLGDVQAKLLSMFNDKTILMGHSLESDFIALKVEVIILLLDSSVHVLEYSISEDHRMFCYLIKAILG